MTESVWEDEEQHHNTMDICSIIGCINDCRVRKRCHFVPANKKAVQYLPQHQFAVFSRLNFKRATNNYG